MENNSNQQEVNQIIADRLRREEESKQQKRDLRRLSWAGSNVSDQNSGSIQ